LTRFRNCSEPYWKSSLLRKVDDGVIDTILEYAQAMPLTPGSFIYMQQLHGAASRVTASDAASRIGAPGGPGLGSRVASEG
jgi:hypothetical protein